MKSVFTIVSSRTTNRDINELYKINPVEVLGSGQFGTVYGGHSIETNEEVAIKVIDKTRFSEQEEKIHREVDILQEISHPGVIKLHAMFDTPGKVRESTRKITLLVVVLFSNGEITFGYVGNDSFATE